MIWQIFLLRKQHIVFRFFGSVWDQDSDQYLDHIVRKLGALKKYIIVQSD